MHEHQVMTQPVHIFIRLDNYTSLKNVIVKYHIFI